jgi:hypothetical protein
MYPHSRTEKFLLTTGILFSKRLFSALSKEDRRNA